MKVKNGKFVDSYNGKYKRRKRQVEVINAYLDKNGLVVHDSIDNGDCFFDAVSQQLGQMPGLISYSIEDLRDICSSYAESHAESELFALLKKREDFKDFKNIKDYVRKIKSDDPPLWGNQDCEGVILARYFKENLGIELVFEVINYELHFDEISGEEISAEDVFYIRAEGKTSTNPDPDNTTPCIRLFNALNHYVACSRTAPMQMEHGNSSAHSTHQTDTTESDPMNHSSLERIIHILRDEGILAEEPTNETGSAAGDAIENKELRIFNKNFLTACVLRLVQLEENLGNRGNRNEVVAIGRLLKSYFDLLKKPESKESLVQFNSDLNLAQQASQPSQIIAILYWGLKIIGLLGGATLGAGLSVLNMNQTHFLSLSGSGYSLGDIAAKKGFFGNRKQFSLALDEIKEDLQSNWNKSLS
ncbi:ankryin [Legionella qingyii]|uniref:Ankryin n=1 Tax=Legionella qingyii TaxID=2184757 RepID=A0A317U1L0_9GAMM|nr:ankryin [Legionella qingyii]PWY54260.1 ankryin [Legionella qingyii]RUR20131.1 ankryin [Legionella qingyii]RUR22393.1 ankryin [Legionella qingyii]